MSQASVRRFSPEEKLDLALRSYRAGNLRRFCRDHGLDRTTLYGWRRELAQGALAGWRGRRLGRPPARARETSASLRETLWQLTERHEALKREARGWQLWAQLAQEIVGPGAPGQGLARLLLVRRSIS